MTVVLVEGVGLGLHRVRLRDRLLTRLRTSALDHELASGVSPESDVALAVHARRLCASSQRELLARSLTRITAASEGPTRSRLKAPIRPGPVRRARAELDAVVARLLSAGPVDVRGVARIRNLVADGTGPLYRKSSPGDLRNELRAALTALDYCV
jgi:hypothetical protein